jgi:hypothetical protein
LSNSSRETKIISMPSGKGSILPDMSEVRDPLSIAVAVPPRLAPWHVWNVLRCARPLEPSLHIATLLSTTAISRREFWVHGP